MQPIESPPTRTSKNLLRAWRKKQHISQAALAKACDVHFTIISQWEQGRCTPSLRTFRKLVDYTGLPPLPLLRFFTRADSGGLAKGS